MAILFCGAEVEDFSTTGTVDIQAAATTFRSAYARCSVQPATGAVGVNTVTASFTAGNQIGLTARVQFGSLTNNTPMLWFSTGGSPRLRLRTVTGTPTTTLILESYTSGAVATTLATSTNTVTSSQLYRMDVLVDYQAAGRVRVWFDGTLYIDYSGDARVSGATTLNSVTFGSAATSAVSRWSEVIITDGEDPRPLSLKSLVPDAIGDTSQWTGAYTDVDEATASDTDVISSGTAAQVTNFNVTGMPAGGSTLAVRAVKVVASALRGSGGPQGLQLGLKSGSTEGWSATKTLDTGYGVVSETWTSNPATSSAFTASEVDALKIAVKSIA